MNNFIPDLENSLEIAELRTEILSKRQAGEVLFDIKKLDFEPSGLSRKALIEIIDLFISKMNCLTLDEQWLEINREDAQKILLLILTKELAYKTTLMSLSEAKQILFRFFSLFTVDCQFFTNASFNNNYSRLKSWSSITTAIFDTGVVIVNPYRIGILWVKDED